MGQQETAQAPTPHHAASDQQAHETALFSGAALEFAFLALALLGAFFHAVVEDCRHEETAQSTPMQTAANQQTCKAVFFLTAFLAFVLAFGPFK